MRSPRRHLRTRLNQVRCARLYVWAASLLRGAPFDGDGRSPTEIEEERLTAERWAAETLPTDGNGSRRNRPKAPWRLAFKECPSCKARGRIGTLNGKTVCFYCDAVLPEGASDE